MPELLPLQTAPRAVIGLTATDARSPLTVGTPVSTFASSVVADALARANEHFETPVAQSDVANWGHHLVEWANSVGVQTIVTGYPTVGTVAERLAAAQADLDAAGIQLVMIMRCYDKIAWPHAAKGFFALRAKIPAIISELEL